MDIILQLFQQRRIVMASIIGVVIGLLLGLAIGWWWWPLELTNATPAHLRSDFQSEYILWVADQYAKTEDLEQARSRLGMEYWEDGQLAETLTRLREGHSGERADNLKKLTDALKEEDALTAKKEKGGLLRSTALVCGIGLLIIAFVGGGFYLFTQLQEQREAPGKATRERRAPSTAREPAPSEGRLWEGDPPLSQFVTTYVLGDDHYDPSFAIELESGEFMGECGVGISETIGVGEPNKVTAFEIWLFDKNDIRTVTKVATSEYAFHDEALSAKLAPRGEPVLAEEGKGIALDTRSLHMQARIVEVEYGEGDLPPDSFFKKLTVDLAVWVKPEGEEAPAEPDIPMESSAA